MGDPRDMAMRGLLFACVSVVVLSAPPPGTRPTVDTLSPASGPLTGGTVVTVKGKNLDFITHCGWGMGSEVDDQPVYENLYEGDEVKCKARPQLCCVSARTTASIGIRITRNHTLRSTVLLLWRSSPPHTAPAWATPRSLSTSGDFLNQRTRTRQPANSTPVPETRLCRWYWTSVNPNQSIDSCVTPNASPHKCV